MANIICEKKCLFLHPTAHYRGSKFTIRMSRDSYNHLKRHLLEKKQKILLTIIQDHLFIDGKIHFLGC